MIRAFPPSADQWLDLARIGIDDAMLTWIARADYGEKAADLFPQLQQIRDTGRLPEPMEFWLSEVLGLTRYCDPDRPDSPQFEPGPTGHRGHQTRMFACAVLLLATATPSVDCNDDNDRATVAQSLASSKVLGEDFCEAVGRFLVWRILKMDVEPDRLMFSLGLLSVVVRLGASRLTELAIRGFAEWIVAEDDLMRFQYRPYFFLDPQFWQPLLKEVEAESRAELADNTRRSLAACAAIIERSFAR